MNLTKNPNLKKKKNFFFLGGGGGGGGGDSNRKKNKRYSLIFCVHALYKISSSWLKWFSSFNTNKRSNGEVRGITLPMFYGIQSKVILTWILNNLLNFRILAQAILYILCWQGFSILIKAKTKKGHNSLYTKYQKPSSSSSQDIILTRFFYCYKPSRKRGITHSMFYGIFQKLIKSYKH